MLPAELNSSDRFHTWKRYKGIFSRANKKVLPEKETQFFPGMCHMLDPIIYYAIPQSTRTKEKLKILKPAFKSPDISVSKDIPLDVRKPVCLENVWAMFSPLFLFKSKLKNQAFLHFRMSLYFQKHPVTLGTSAPECSNFRYWKRTWFPEFLTFLTGSLHSKSIQDLEH